MERVRFALMLSWVVPAIAIAVFARQMHLQRADNLSIWEGGGMGMFAEIGGFARVAMPFYVDEAGNRHPIVALTESQKRIAGFARKRPTEDNLSQLAELIAGSSWVAIGPAETRVTVDRNGQPIGSAGTPQLLLIPASSLGVSASLRNAIRPSVDGGRVEIEYWEIRYDPGTRVATRELKSEVSR